MVATDHHGQQTPCVGRQACWLCKLWGPHTWGCSLQGSPATRQPLTVLAISSRKPETPCPTGPVDQCGSVGRESSHRAKGHRSGHVSKVQARFPFREHVRGSRSKFYSHTVSLSLCSPLCKNKTTTNPETSHKNPDPHLALPCGATSFLATMRVPSGHWAALFPATHRPQSLKCYWKASKFTSE